MAMQTGMGLSKIIILLSAGYTGTILMKDGKLSDVIGEIQAVVKGLEKKTDNGNSDDPIVAQVHRLAQEIRQLASARQVTVFNSGSGQTDVSSLIVPAATLGALGYVYMWWKGLSFSDLKYVTQRSMDAAVQNLTQQLGNATDCLFKIKRHLSQRIDSVDCKADEQKEMTKIAINEVQDCRGDVAKLRTDINSLEDTVYSLGERIFSLEDKQVRTLMGVNYLIQVADTEVLRAELSNDVKGRKACAQLSFADALSRPGLKNIAEFLAENGDSGKEVKPLTQDGDSGKQLKLLTLDSDSDFDKPEYFARTVSAKCSE